MAYINGTDLSLLMDIFNHSTQQMTLGYIGITKKTKRQSICFTRFINKGDVLYEMYILLKKFLKGKKRSWIKYLRIFLIIFIVPGVI